MKFCLEGKRIIVGVCGGIAAYKSLELIRLLRKEQVEVNVIMTKAASQFVTPFCFEVISGHHVYTDVFSEEKPGEITHIEWAKRADAAIIAPATANIIAKLACGIADDALSTCMLAMTRNILVCPSMNSDMYQNRIVQRNMDTLEQFGFMIIDPQVGELACGVSGVGRLADPETILDRLCYALSPKDFAGKHILVTAGPTQEAIDPVRFISNHSSGKMGYAIAKAAEHRGACVTLISGPTHLSSPINVTVEKIGNAQQMADAVFQHQDHMDIIIKVAAVADYRPEHQSLQKIKKSADEHVLLLKKNVDILLELGKKKKQHQILVGFAAETNDLQLYATEKLIAKNLDMIVANRVGIANSGFGVDTNQVTLYYQNGKHEELPLLEKDTLAHVLLDRIARMNRIHR
ncbi:MAG: bifunctional phosphopantothenoylcysteine decarboxylase/phosphopantothenate--cysteine ligase CoaBC [Desulfobacterales bacterium]|nr:bifunctional phosphopantothenoylcysteine decarboxylase/phosphopantothenate--cysteine ligase CoaBC [Desulfobacterales bacterium]